MSERTIYSFVLDSSPKYTYQGWHLARSLIEHCGADPSEIHIHYTPEVDPWRIALFRAEGYVVHRLERFGDGSFCNKLGELPNLADVACDRVVLLDTDTILVSDLRPFLPDGAVAGKVVDVANPPIDVLREIAAASGLSRPAVSCRTDDGRSETFVGNFNGGLYVVPKPLCEPLSVAWRRWSIWLLDHIAPLERVGRARNVDQVSFWLAVQHEGFPLEVLPSNANYFTHFSSDHVHFDAARDIALLHYHETLNVLGLIDASKDARPAGRDAVARANAQIGRGFNSRIFWDFRYSHFPERGSGFGSRGENLEYKRDLLLREGIEAAGSVLDIGCGDLEVLRVFEMRNYLGIDVSPAALARARGARPDLSFKLLADLEPTTVLTAEMVLCFEVLIHQPSRAEYLSVIDMLARATQKTLVVSGYDTEMPDVSGNHMIHAHEPLSVSLRDTGRFRSVEKIGQHTSVVVFRCRV